jgi:hypothetical protein
MSSMLEALKVHGNASAKVEGASPAAKDTAGSIWPAAPLAMQPNHGAAQHAQERTGPPGHITGLATYGAMGLDPAGASARGADLQHSAGGQSLSPGQACLLSSAQAERPLEPHVARHMTNAPNHELQHGSGTPFLGQAPSSLGRQHQLAACGLPVLNMHACVPPAMLVARGASSVLRGEATT